MTAFAVAAGLAARRWSGHGDAPSASIIVCVALALVGFALLVRFALGRIPSSDNVRRWPGWQLLLSGTLVLAAGAVALPNAPTAGLIALCVLVTAEETWWWSVARRNASNSSTRASPSVARPSFTTPDEASAESPRERADEAIDEAASETEEAQGLGDSARDEEFPDGEEALDGEEDGEERLLPDGVSQQWTRSTSDERGEVLEGLMRATFAPGQKIATLHAAFCPPLATVPTIEAQWLAGTNATVSVALAQPFGARLEVKLARAAAAPAEAVILVTATCRSLPSTSCSTPPAVR